MVTIVGNPLEATANDSCVLVNQASGCAACAKAVLFLEEERMLGASLIVDYVMDCNDCIREQFRGIFFDTDERFVLRPAMLFRRMCSSII